MTGSSLTHSPNSSSGIITGTFGAIEYVDNMLREYDKVLMQILHGSAAKAQTDLRKQASQSNTGWAEIADSISVEYVHDNRQFSYTITGDEATQEKAMNLEYGNGHLAPTPLLRGSILQQQDKQTEEINSSLRKTLLEHRNV
jgi:hypothetical protein